MTSLHHAADCGRKEDASLFLDRGADIAAKDEVAFQMCCSDICCFIIAVINLYIETLGVVHDTYYRPLSFRTA
jgi:hypothetical protein